MRGSTAAAATLLALAAISFCLTPVYSENLFWHLRNGEDILDTAEVRTTDPFTWTMRGEEWLQQEWLAEAAFAAAWRAAGAGGLMALKTAVVLATVLLAFAAASRRGAAPWTVLMASLLWLPLAQARWFERPHIFTDLFFALFLLLRPGSRRISTEVLIFTPLMVLWTNTHAGFLMGLALLGLPAVDRLVSGDLRGAAGRLIVPLAALLSTGVHPNGFRSLLYLPDFLSRPLFRASIREWWSPFDPRYGSVWLPAALVALTILSAALLARGRRRAAPSDFVLLAALTASSVFASRNCELLALSSIVCTARLMGGVPRAAPALMAAAACAIPPLFGLPREFGPPRRFGTGIDWSIYPVGLADFLDRTGLRGRVFNTNEISGYLQYRFGEDLPLYMDGRCHLYPEDFYAEYLLLGAMPDSGPAAAQLAALEERGIDLALYGRTSLSGSSANLLAELPGWEPVYWDGLTLAYAREDLLARMGLESLSTGPADPLSPEFLMQRPLVEVPAAELPQLERASGMEGWDAPRLLTCCLLRRSGNWRGALAAAAAIEDPALRLDALTAGFLPVDAPHRTPQTLTLLAWRLAGEGRTAEAVEAALASGDTGLAGSLLLLAGDPDPALQPPWLPPGAWEGYLSGGAGPGESAAVEAAALLAAGDAPAAASRAQAGGRGAPWTASCRAQVLASTGSLEEAARLADSAVAAAPNPFTLAARGRVEIMSGRPGGAVRWLAGALSMAPGASGIALDLAGALWDAGAVPDAAALYSSIERAGAGLPGYAATRLSWVRLLQGS